MSPAPYDRHYQQGGFGYHDRIDHWRAWVRRNYIDRFGLRPGERLLDVGCGDGFWSSLFDEAGLVVCGFDLSPGGIQVARERYPGPSFAVGDLDSEFPFQDQQFDVVFARGLSHLCRDIDGEPARRAIARMSRLVAPGGILLISQYSRRDGTEVNSTVNYRASELFAAIETSADPIAYELVDNHMLCAATPVGAARRADSSR